MADVQGAVVAPTTPVVAATSAIMGQLINATTTPAGSSLSSSSRELLSLPFRALYRAETFALQTLPRSIARSIGLENMARNLWDNGPAVGLEGEAVAAAAHAAGEGVAEAAAQDAGFHMMDILQAMRRFSGFFSYLTSRWSLACFTVALILNRITIYASTRRHLNLHWERRLALRIVPILLFVSQIVVLLRAIRCQTSPDYSAIRYGKPGKRLIFEYAGQGGFLYSMSSTLLSWESDEQSCSAVNMGQPLNASDIQYGSFALLWPVFMRLCLSHFVETMSCALQGRPVITEAGMSIFEHSLAFAEAESMISQSIGLGIFGLPKQTSTKDDLPLSTENRSPVHLLTRAQVLDRMNVTPELLLIVLISCCNSLMSNLLDVFGKQSRYRLFNTTIWGLCFMAAMVWGLLDGSSEAGVLKFPTVCIVGFIPHLLILLGILSCLTIYALALFITAYSMPMETSQPLSLRERLMIAHDNMQGADQIRNIRFSRHEDFYTALLRIGYAALTAASDAVFLNEGKPVVARRMTWLEEDRLSEIEATRRRRPSSRRWAAPEADGPFEGDMVHFDIPEAPSEEWESGYNREKKIEKPRNGSRSARSSNHPGGVGAFRWPTRYYHGLSFFRSISSLLSRWSLYGLSRLLDKLGIEAQPRWLKKGSHRKDTRKPSEPLDFWILSDLGELEIPEDDEFDVEREMRKRERSNLAWWEQSDEHRLDEKLYSWWKAGGSWGNQDETPDYAPSESDLDDTTSVVSTSETTSEAEWEEYESDDGRRTPTQEDPFPNRISRENTPMRESLFDASTLARLLDPRDTETKEEARILAAHLTAEREGRIMTRRQYQKQRESEQAQILLSNPLYRRPATDSSNGKRKPTHEEEAEILEKLILSRRAEAATSASQAKAQTWASGASGLGADGPQCVICQTQPRCIITWPCRCLCVCEECRVNLAMNNFGSCVTCRQEVGGFVRLWVP